MADKLDWLNDHLILLKHRNVQDVVFEENYKVPFALKELAYQKSDAESFVKQLATDNKYKEANDFLAYNLHQRALTWWGYCCVLSMIEEQKINPAPIEDIADIAKPREFDIPDFAKEVEKKDPEVEAKINEMLEELNKRKSNLEAIEKDLRSQLPKDVLDDFNEAQGIFQNIFKEQVGMTFDDFFNSTLQKLMDAPIDEPLVDTVNSPIYKEERKLDEKLEKIRQDTIQTIKTALPDPDPKEVAMLKANALDAAYNYIVAPDDHNAKVCLDVGNTCPDKPEGLLALVCFWSFGNLMPESNQLAKTPVGLASNGMSGLLTMLSLQKGGTRNNKERIEHYFDIGKEIALGLNNWAEHLVNRIPPHRMQGSDVFNGMAQNTQWEHDSTRETVNVRKEVLVHNETLSKVNKIFERMNNAALKEAGETENKDENKVHTFSRFKI